MNPQACNQPFCTRKAISKLLLHATSIGMPHHGQVRWQQGHLAVKSTMCAGGQTEGSCLQAAPIGSSQCPTQGATYLPLVAAPMRSSSCCLRPLPAMAWNRLQGQHLEIMAELQKGIQPWHVWAKRMTLSLPVSIPNLHLWHRATPDGLV